MDYLRAVRALKLCAGTAATLACVVTAAQTPPRATAAATQSTPPWAYPVLAPGYKVEPDDGVPRHVPDSASAFTLTQLRDLFNAYDWFPQDHPVMPEVVAH